MMDGVAAILDRGALHLGERDLDQHPLEIAPRLEELALRRRLRDAPPVTLVVAPTRTVTGSAGAVVVRKGEAVEIDHATVGEVTVKPGGALLISDSTVRGDFVTSKATSVSVCGSTLKGRVTVDQSTGFVLVGDGGDDPELACAPNTITGRVELSNNRRGVEMGGNTAASSVQVSGTRGAGPTAEHTAPEIEGNSIHGGLDCRDNRPAPVNDGQPNTVAGRKTHQCSVF